MDTPEIRFDENLRDVPVDLSHARAYVETLQKLIPTTSDLPKIRLKSEAGVWLRTLGDLAKAEQLLTEALNAIHSEELGRVLEVQTRIRLAHVLQWQKRFAESTEEFSKLVHICATEEDARVYLDFAWQHSGKNFFDQARYPEAAHAFETALDLRRQRNAPEEQIDSSLTSLQRTQDILKA